MFSGSIVALVTPFNADGEVDFDSLKKLVEHHVAAGSVDDADQSHRHAAAVAVAGAVCCAAAATSFVCVLPRRGTSASAASALDSVLSIYGAN